MTVPTPDAAEPAASDSGQPTPTQQIPVHPSVHIMDAAPSLLRHPRDLIGVALSVIGIVGVFVLSVFAHGTTEGIASDVREFSTLLARILFFPVAVLELLIMLGVPIAVMIELSVKRLWRQSISSILATILGLGLGLATAWAVSAFASEAMIEGLSIRTGGGLHLTLPIYVSGIVGLLTAAGPSTRRRSVRWSWNLLWFSLAVVLITGQVSIPGVLLTLLLGRMSGLAIRYILGVSSERASGPGMIDALRRVGFDPIELVRVRDVSSPEEWADEIVGSVIPSSAIGTKAVPSSGTTHLSLTGDDEQYGSPAIHSDALDPASVAITRYSDNRVYALTTADDEQRLDVVVLDGDRQVIGFLNRLWRSFRLRGIEGRSRASLRSVAERAALLAYAAEAAGVRTPRLRGMAEVEDSMLLVKEHSAGAVSLRDLPDSDLTDDVLDEMWRQLSLAHQHGLSHRSLTVDVLLVQPPSSEGKPRVLLTGWESGDVAASELARRMDLAQMLALMALRVGAARAIESGVRARINIEQVGPLLQTPAMPSETRVELRKNKKLMPGLREELVTRLPAADVEPVQLVRVSTRTLVMSILTVVALIVVMTTVNFDQIKDAVLTANPWWMLASFLLGLTTWVGAALALMAFSPVKLPFLRTFWVQAASSFVALAAPSGIGPAALNLRMLTRRKVSTSLAVATVSLVQVSQFVVTIVVLLTLSLITGNGGVLRSLPSTTVLSVLAGLILTVAAVLIVPQVRRWLSKKVMPIFQQIWPRLSAVLGQPWRLGLGFAGNAIMTFGYVLAFDAALAAFGQQLSLIDTAVIYLVGNAVGAAVPTPGGVGAIEIALITGLTTTAGIPAPIATSAVVLFRVVTYWARIPLGWIAMQISQRNGEL